MTDRAAGRAVVAAPATSANLGPGFDAFGLGLGLYDRVECRVAESGVEVDITGEGADAVARDESHLIVRALRATFDVLGVAQPGLALTCANVIPHGRGLGSSSAAIVSGIRLAEALVADAALPPAQALALATELEGHPDNVAACLFGGFTIAWSAADGPQVLRLEVSGAVHPVAFVPALAVSTELARGLLPAEVSHRAASANAGRAALLVAALTGRPDMLLAATEDQLHQEFRRPAMPESMELVTSLRAAGVAAVVSGAGPTVLALTTGAELLDTASWTPDGWRALHLEVDTVGARITS